MSPVGVIDFEVDPPLARERLTDIDELAGRNGNLAIDRNIDRHPCLQLHFRISRSKHQHVVARSDEDVREHRNRVSLLDDPSN